MKFFLRLSSFFLQKLFETVERVVVYRIRLVEYKLELLIFHLHENTS